MYSKKIEEKREKEIEEKKTAMRRKVQEGEGKQKRVENEEKRQEKYGSYKELLKTSITKKWFLNPAFIEKQNLKAEVEIVIDNDGNINTKKVKSSSSNKHFDEMVIDAISRSNPLPAVPPDLRENHYLDIKLEFTLEDYEKLHD
jgi:TonB family protein